MDAHLLDYEEPLPRRRYQVPQWAWLIAGPVFATVHVVLTVCVQLGLYFLPKSGLLNWLSIGMWLPIRLFPWFARKHAATALLNSVLCAVLLLLLVECSLRVWNRITHRTA